jgi:hypothetical protein
LKTCKKNKTNTNSIERKVQLKLKQTKITASQFIPIFRGNFFSHTSVVGLLHMFLKPANKQKIIKKILLK